MMFNFFVFLSMMYTCMGMCCCAYLWRPAIYKESSTILHFIFWDMIFSLNLKLMISYTGWQLSPRIFKASLPSSEITGVCQYAHFRRLRCLRWRQETRSYVLVRYILNALLSTKLLIWPTMKGKYAILYIRQTHFHAGQQYNFEEF